MIFNIQSLRAFAALSVAYFHTDFGGIRFGSFGVDVFFVISGFIMAHICQTDSDHFFLRRLIRIVPLYWALTLVMFGLAKFAPSLVYRATADWADLARSLFFIPYQNKGGLVQPELFLGWTLNYEMFFYVNVALALLIVPPRFAAGLAAAFIVGIWATLKLTQCTSVLCQFYGNPIVVEFILGIAAYQVFTRVSRELAMRTLLLWLGLFAVSLMAIVALNARNWGSANGNLLISLPNEFHVEQWPYFGIIAFGIVLSALISERGGARLTWGWALLLGNASYVIYLIHPYIAQGMDRIVSRWLPELTTRTVWGLLVYFAVVMTLSVAVHILIERRIIDLGRTHLSRGRVPLSRKGVAPA
jgi:peptidoglycan/LPS O-acetylase OafA/YrhL